MGLPMASLHSPSVASSSNQQNGRIRTQKTSITDLMSRKQNIEAELSALSSVLDSHGMNMNTGLTTFDGFPRADIDVAQVRTTRARIIYLRNDYKALMGQIETALHEHYATTAAADAAEAVRLSSTTDASPNDVSSSATLETPFAMVNSVVPGSPAETAGMKAGDRIQRFGDANWLNHEKLSKVAQIVAQNEGRSISVQVRRQEGGSSVEVVKNLTLVPRRDWGGRGLLGCHLLPT